MRFVRIRGRRAGRYALLTGLVIALGSAPFALAGNGDPVTAGGRTTFTQIARVLGNSTTYATQQSNLNNGDGGAARYGCRSKEGLEFCLLSKNTGGGGSFRFQSLNSLIGGSIEVEPRRARPRLTPGPSRRTPRRWQRASTPTASTASMPTRS